MTRKKFKDIIRYERGYISGRPEIDDSTYEGENVEDYATEGSQNVLFTGEAEPVPFKGLTLVDGIGVITGGGPIGGLTNIAPTVPPSTTPVPTSPVCFRVETNWPETDISMSESPLGTYSMTGVSSTSPLAVYGGYISDDLFDLTGKFVQMEIVAHDLYSSNDNVQAWLKVFTDFDDVPPSGSVQNAARFGTDGFQRIAVNERIGGAVYQNRLYSGWPDPWNPIAHRFLRIRESSGTLYYEYSTTGAAWTTLWSNVNPFNITSVRLAVYQLQSTTAAIGHTTTLRDFATQV